MRKPVVALSHGGAGEIVVHNQTGLLSSLAHVERLAAHLSRRLGERCRLRVQDKVGHPELPRKSKPFIATSLATAGRRPLLAIDQPRTLNKIRRPPGWISSWLQRSDGLVSRHERIKITGLVAVPE